MVRVLGHLGTQGTPTLEGQSGTRALQAPGHSGTWALRDFWALEAHLGTRTLRHSGTWALEALYLANSVYSKLEVYQE